MTAKREVNITFTHQPLNETAILCTPGRITKDGNATLKTTWESKFCTQLSESDTLQLQLFGQSIKMAMGIYQT